MRYFAQVLGQVNQPAANQTAASWKLNRWSRRGVYALFAFAGYLFTRAHLLNTIQFLNLPAYLAGHERLPFQRRVLPMLLLHGLERITPAAWHIGRHGIFAQPLTAYLFLLDLISVAAAAYFCMRLHIAAQPRSRAAAIACLSSPSFSGRWFGAS